MATILRTSIKRLPSGMISVISSCVSSSRSLGSRAKLKHTPLAFARILAIADSYVQSLKSVIPSGYGGLGRKKKASWKSLRQARERMAAIELVYSKEKCGFLTVTLPSVDIDSFESLARFSSYAMNRLNLSLNRYFAGQDLARVSVWEYQSRGALHCHLLLASHCMDTINKAEFIAYMQKAWYRILSSIGEFCSCNMFLGSDGKTRSLRDLQAIKNKKDENVFVNFQIVKKSIIAYLSRYLADSNHESKKKNKNALREFFYPIATWLQWNRTATKCYEEKCDIIDLGECEPDKKKTIQSILNSLKKDIFNLIPLARETEIKEPKNPYNAGLYFLPANPESPRLNSLLAEYCVKLSSFHWDSLRDRYQPKQRQKTQDELDVHLTLQAIEEKREKHKKDCLRWLGNDSYEIARNLANFGFFVLDLVQDFRQKTTPKKYYQLEIDYGL